MTYKRTLKDKWRIFLINAKMLLKRNLTSDFLKSIINFIKELR